MKPAVERLICMDPANSDAYLKVLEDISKERRELNKRVTEAYKYARAKQKQVTTENLVSNSEKIKIQSPTPRRNGGPVQSMDKRNLSIFQRSETRLGTHNRAATSSLKTP